MLEPADMQPHADMRSPTYSTHSAPARSLTLAAGVAAEPQPLDGALLHRAVRREVHAAAAHQVLHMPEC